MIHRVLIIGGYGNFGSFISKTLALESTIQVIVAGRSLEKAKQLVSGLVAVNKPEAVALNIHDDFPSSLKSLAPNIVIHTSGPFQEQGYHIARTCIKQGVHYIDLADGRSFVENIESLNEDARKQNVLVVSGASSVPCLTSALVDYYKSEFKVLDSLDYGITTAQKTARGLATTTAILSYTGKPFKTKIDGKQHIIYGWQGLKARKYKKLGWRLIGNCDVPDLALFPKRYPGLKTIRFYAGLELPFIHCTLWGLSWLVRLGLIRKLEKAGDLLLRISFLFDFLGSDNSAFHMVLSGKDEAGQDKVITFELTASSGDGPYIPCMPAILMTKNLVRHEIDKYGAFPCVGFITRDQYLNALSELDITWEDY